MTSAPTIVEEELHRWWNKPETQKLVAQRPGLADGHYWSPDCGYFVVKDRMMYLASGDVWDSAESIVRIGLGPTTCPEDFSAWDDDRRCLELAISQAQRELWEEEKAAAKKRRARLLKSARKKLTEAEVDAVLYIGRYGEDE